ncbi:hypothetical protein ACIBH1_37945 [Nonomuraea sp. NPDC050663]|uniref:hypothetical protein n=1 Tax=Nonomuraea sp. NPDC050663 TaxID=3364370 RepID=UPI0037A84D37
MEIRDYDSDDVVKYRSINAGTKVDGKVPEAGDAPGDLSGRYYVVITRGCYGSKVTISS